MGSFLADCMSSLEQIRQQAAGSLVEQHATFCHRRDEWEESSITAFVKALSQGDERLMTALLKLGMEHWGKSGLSSEVQTEIWGLDTVLIVWLEQWLNAKCFETGGTHGKKKKKLTKCVMNDEVFKFQWLLLSCSAAHCSVRQRAGLCSSSSTLYRGQGGGRETGDLCPSVTHAALGLMLMENEMFRSLAEKYSSL